MRLAEFVEREPGADVLIVTNVWPEPARPVYGIFVQRQVESIRKQGVRCDVLYIRGVESFRAYLQAAWRLAISSVIWHGRYRVVHAHAAEAGLAARLHVGSPVVVSYFGDDLLGDRDETGRLAIAAHIRARFVRWHSQLFDATITKSRAMEDVLPPRTRRKNHVVPNGVDPNLFAPVERCDARRALGWGEEPVALFVATKPASPAKRLPLAGRACVAAGVRLHVAEDVEPTSMPLLMGAADCLLVTSAVEGSPNAVKEALMCGLPVIATAVGDIVERLQGVEPSWICAPETDALAEALRDCVASRRRSNGREHAAGLAEDRVAARITAIYDWVGR